MLSHTSYNIIIYTGIVSSSIRIAIINGEIKKRKQTDNCKLLYYCTLLYYISISIHPGVSRGNLTTAGMHLSLSSSAFAVVLAGDFPSVEYIVKHVA